MLENNFSKKYDLIVVPTTKKYLEKRSRLLEAGCGHGTNVINLKENGFDCIGIDFAVKTINNLNKRYPNYKFIKGDIRKLPFNNNSFDGYWSLGVIEHFFLGYNKVFLEMKRVLKRKGFAFITFPYMSPIRKLKARSGKYRLWNQEMSKKNFYQFALDKNDVIKDLEQLGFKLIDEKPFDGVSGLRKEVKSLSFILEPLSRYSGRFLIAAAVSFVISKIVEKFTSHSILLVAQKN